MNIEERNKFNEFVSQFICEIIPVDDKRTHYHFKRKKDLKVAMRWNFNAWDTFSYASKNWKGKIPTREDLISSEVQE